MTWCNEDHLVVSDLNQLRKANKIRHKEWCPNDNITLEYRGLELAGEVGEACNVMKKLARQQLGMVGSQASVQDLSEELADIVICVDLIAMQFGINLAEVVVDKFNKTSVKYKLKTRL